MLFSDLRICPLRECGGRRLSETVVLVALQSSSRQARQIGAETVSRVRRSYCDGLAPRARSSFVEIFARNDLGQWL